MQTEKYPFVKVDEFHYYEFDSKGPKGVVRKIVLYINTNFQEKPIFNLAFGDRNPLTGELDDSVVTNNNDRKKILSTVAATVLQFIKERPHGVVFAEGATPARNRLYRMGIGSIWSEIKKEMDLYGRVNKRWYKFTTDKNFDAFLLAHKSLKYNPNDKKIIK